jgi:hypothetical protein
MLTIAKPCWVIKSSGRLREMGMPVNQENRTTETRLEKA